MRMRMRAFASMASPRQSGETVDAFRNRLPKKGLSPGAMMMMRASPAEILVVLSATRWLRNEC
jgi:hypothetical protein